MKEQFPETYGCLSCKTAASFKGLVDRMPILQSTCCAPVTTLVVKDRVLDHHTVQALRGGELASLDESHS